MIEQGGDDWGGCGPGLNWHYELTATFLPANIGAVSLTQSAWILLPAVASYNLVRVIPP